MQRLPSFDHLQKQIDVSLALDMGSQTTRLSVIGTKKEQSLPTVLALAEDKKTILGIGEEAQELMGKVGNQMRIAQPIQDGVLRDIGSTIVFLRYLFQRHLKYAWVFKPNVLASVAADATTVEREALRDVLYESGAKKVYLVDQPLAAAIGAGIPVAQSSGNVVIHLGAGVTEMAVISLGTGITHHGMRWGGHRLDESILKFIRTRHQVDVSLITAEYLKKNMQSVFEVDARHALSVKGRHIVTGVPTEAHLKSSDVLQAIQPAIDELVIQIKEFLEDVPPEIATDVMDKGIILTGGASQLPGLIPLLTESLGVPLTLADRPTHAVMEGLKIVGQHLDLYERSLAFTRGNES